jgi:hypothetical protein
VKLNRSGFFSFATVARDLDPIMSAAASLPGIGGKTSNMIVSKTLTFIGSASNARNPGFKTTQTRCQLGLNQHRQEIQKLEQHDGLSSSSDGILERWQTIR